MRFTIRYADGKYRVSIPNYDGGEVVSAEAYDNLAERVKTLEDVALAYRELCTCYRIGRQPSERLFERLDAAKQALAAKEPK